jgi:spermidine synthase
MTIIFTIAIFLAAALLFAVQPMVAKALLPLFGGGSSVWTACMLFFQVLLLAGYLYAHVLGRLARGAQLMVHAVVLAGAVVALVLARGPVGKAVGIGDGVGPLVSLLATLGVVAGAGFFAIASAGPLLQRWFAMTGHPRGHDPYFLYAASNAGSLLGLLAYPFVIEPRLGLVAQRDAWLVGFVCFGVLAVVCGASMVRARAGAPASAGAVHPRAEHAPGPAPTWADRVRWTLLAFVPSGFLLAVTTHISTDVAAFPLLWVLPLAVYLLTFIAAFGGPAAKIVRHAHRPAAVALIVLAYLEAAKAADFVPPQAALIALNLIGLGVVGLLGHARLAAGRPHGAHLTEFYLCISVGGALGGVLNSVVAPIVFNGPHEYGVMILAASLLLPWSAWVARAKAGAKAGGGGRFEAFAVAGVAGLVLAGVVAGALVLLDRRSGVGDTLLLTLVALPAVLAVMASREGRALSACLFGLLLCGAVAGGLVGTVLLRERTFYGSYRVSRIEAAGVPGQAPAHQLFHGTTIHGAEIMGGPMAGVPLTYYFPEGPLGDVFGVLADRQRPFRACAIGLGIGSVAAYGRAGDEITFIEIDPEVEAIARRPEFFTYLSEPRAKVDVLIGDGRLVLEGMPAERRFDLIVADAFTSDAVPVHLLTVEAIGLYLDRLGHEGMVAIHLSNRYLVLAPVVIRAAKEAGAIALLRNDAAEMSAQTQGYFPSQWVVLTRSPEAAQSVLSSRSVGTWQVAQATAGAPLWTDDFSNILSVFDYSVLTGAGR